MRCLFFVLIASALPLQTLNSLNQSDEQNKEPVFQDSLGRQTPSPDPAPNHSELVRPEEPVPDSLDDLVDPGLHRSGTESVVATAGSELSADLSSGSSSSSSSSRVVYHAIADYSLKVGGKGVLVLETYTATPQGELDVLKSNSPQPTIILRHLKKVRARKSRGPVPRDLSPPARAPNQRSRRKSACPDDGSNKSALSDCIPAILRVLSSWNSNRKHVTAGDQHIIKYAWKANPPQRGAAVPQPTAETSDQTNDSSSEDDDSAAFKQITALQSRQALRRAAEGEANDERLYRTPSGTIDSMKGAAKEPNRAAIPQRPRGFPGPDRPDLHFYFGAYPFSDQRDEKMDEDSAASWPPERDAAPTTPQPGAVSGLSSVGSETLLPGQEELEWSLHDLLAMAAAMSERKQKPLLRRRHRRRRQRRRPRPHRRQRREAGFTDKTSLDNVIEDFIGLHPDMRFEDTESLEWIARDSNTPTGEELAARQVKPAPQGWASVNLIWRDDVKPPVASLHPGQFGGRGVGEGGGGASGRSLAKLEPDMPQLQDEDSLIETISFDGKTLRRSWNPLPAPALVARLPYSPEQQFSVSASAISSSSSLPSSPTNPWTQLAASPRAVGEPGGAQNGPSQGGPFSRQKRIITDAFHNPVTLRPAYVRTALASLRREKGDLDLDIDDPTDMDPNDVILDDIIESNRLRSDELHMDERIPDDFFFQNRRRKKRQRRQQTDSGPRVGEGERMVKKEGSPGIQIESELKDSQVSSSSSNSSGPTIVIKTVVAETFNPLGSLLSAKGQTPGAASLDDDDDQNGGDGEDNKNESEGGGGGGGDDEEEEVNVADGGGGRRVVKEEADAEIDEGDETKDAASTSQPDSEEKQQKGKMEKDRVFLIKPAPEDAHKIVRVTGKLIEDTFYRAVTNLLDDKFVEPPDPEKEVNEDRVYYDSLYQDYSGPITNLLATHRNPYNQNQDFDDFFTSSRLNQVMDKPKRRKGMMGGGGVKEEEKTADGAGRGTDGTEMKDLEPGEKPSRNIPGYVDDRAVQGSEETGLEGPSNVMTRLMLEDQQEEILDPFK